MNFELITIRSLVHHVEHLVLYSLVWWQIVLGVWLVLKWVNRNWKIQKNVSITPSPTENKPIQPVINIDGSSISDGVVKSKKNTGPVEVDMNKNIFVDKPDEVNVKLDNVKKGKVETQKDKLKKLRGK
tara:strand:- start:225 stop:608 length:384 start_codon:yes stop_codon:yes gene_type:complete